MRGEVKGTLQVFGDLRGMVLGGVGGGGASQIE